MEHCHFMWYNETITLILHYIEICAETNFGMVAKFCSTQNETEDCVLMYELGLLTEMDNLIFKVDFPAPKDQFDLYSGEIYPLSTSSPF